MQQFRMLTLFKRLLFLLFEENMNNGLSSEE